MSRPDNRRRRLFIDGKLQGRLLVALIVLEVTLLLSAILYLYGSFSNLLESQLYSVHRTAQPPLLWELAKELGTVVLVMSIINTAALWLAHLLWNRYVHMIIDRFNQQLLEIKALNFRPATPESLEQGEALSHELLDLLSTWRRGENQRISRIIEELSNLPPLQKRYSVTELHALRGAITRSRVHLRTPRSNADQAGKPG